MVDAVRKSGRQFAKAALLSTTVGGDLYLLQFGDDQERARYRTERNAERTRVRQRYLERLITHANLDETVAERAVAVIFDHFEEDGSRCACSCHPQLSTEHGDGMDCPCTWDRQRREAEHRTRWAAIHDSEWSQAIRAQHEAEERELRGWLAGQRAVRAERTSTFAPEQWDGTVDGHSFYFRERHGEWRIELDMKPCGRFAQRVVAVDQGRPVTEPVELTEGEVIAEGIDGALGSGPVEHLDFIVRTIREHLWRQSCSHRGALLYCPQCGTRM